MTDLKPLYVDAVRALAKAEGRQTPSAYVRSINRIHDDAEPKVAKVVLSIIKRARTRFRRKLSLDALTDLLATIHKDESDDVRERLRVILDGAFDGGAADLVASETGLIDELASQFKTVHDVDLNFNVINEKAVDYLEDHAESFFTTLSQDQVDGLMAEVAEQLKSDAGYRLRDVAANIRDAFLNDSLYYATDIGTRTLDVTQWSMLVARTETARAASVSQQATLESIGLQTWQWQSQGSCCDDCDDNADEIVQIGEDFPSGDSQPPAHPNCRCVVLPVQSELASVKDESDDSSEDTE